MCGGEKIEFARVIARRQGDYCTCLGHARITARDNGITIGTDGSGNTIKLRSGTPVDRGGPRITGSDQTRAQLLAV